MSALERFFQVRERGSRLGTEVRAGVTTFMAMAYVAFANPAILSMAGVPFEGAVVATCLAAGVVTILMGVVTNYPMCLAAGMGLNAVVAFTIVLGMKQPWQAAMGVIVVEGLVVLALSATAFRQSVMEAIPAPLKHAIAVGIGLFLTFIGLQQGHFIQANPATLVTFGDFTHPVALLAAAGLALTGWLIVKRVRGALLIGILLTAALGILPIWHLPAGAGSLGDVAQGLAGEARWGPLISLPRQVLGIPRDWSTIFRCDVKAALTPMLLPVTFAVFMTDFFDTMGTAIAVGTQAGFVDPRGRIARIRGLLVVDSLGAVFGGLFGCSSNTCYIESSAGVAEGGRTGLTAVVCGLLFLAALFVTPIIGVVGAGVQVAPGVVRYPVTAAALIVVGFLMMRSVLEVDWSSPAEALPSFLTMVVMPLTFSITHGIGAGFVSYVVWKALTGRAREIRPFLWLVAAMFVVVFALPFVERAVGAAGG